jgi:hypothetical protein
MGIKCFFLVDTGRARISLRRYHSSSDAEQKCVASGLSYHNANNYIEDRPVIYAEEQHGKQDCYHGSQEHDGNDPRWPTHCACGYAFTGDDPKQVFQDTILRRTDTGEEMTWNEAPPGAMRDCCWIRGEWSGPDGMSITVKCPDATDWLIDGPSYHDGKQNHPHPWTRTGTPPDISVTPSILTPTYHGFLGSNGASPGYFTGPL